MIIPLIPVIIPAIDIPFLLDFNPIVPKTIAKIAHVIDIYHTQERTIATTPRTKAAMLNPFLSFCG